MKVLCALLALCTTVLAQDYIEGQYFIHVDHELVKTEGQESAFVDVLKTQFNADVRKFYHFNPRKMLFVHATAEKIELVRKLKEVTLVEQDAWAYADQDCTPVSHPGVWGLDRIDQASGLPYTSPSDPSATYSWNTNDGTGVNVYVFDTGIDFVHSNFEGRADFAYTASGITNPGEDNNGHGTHCAGTIGSRDYGVAKNCNPRAIKILNDGGSGPWSAIIEGMEWLTNNGARGTCVGSMSVGGSGQNDSVRIALEALVASGCPVAVSAGNSNLDACLQTPAYVPAAITVGATDVNDVRASFSNFGDCCDIFGPGVSVLSTTPGESTDIFSGTSMSCPHVAGSAARYRGANPSGTPDDVVNWLTTNATPGLITDLPSGPNLLLHLACV